MALPRLLDVTEVAEYLGRSRSGVYNLLASGELPSVRVGKHRRVREDDLERYIESGAGYDPQTLSA